MLSLLTPLPTQQPVTLVGLSGATLSWWKHDILTTPFQQPVTLVGLSGTTLSWWKHDILTTPFWTEIAEHADKNPDWLDATAD
jgi:hypothetical protein